MKKNSFLFLCGILAMTMVNAQSFELGIKGGLNIPASSVAIGVDDPTLDYLKSSGSGYHAGIFAKFKVAMFAINPEVLYSFQSTEFKLKDISGASVKQEVTYLTVPVIVRFYLPLGLNFQAGPQFGFPIEAIEEVDLGGNLDKNDLKKEVSAMDLGLNLGFGIDLPFGLDVHARYVIGLTDVNDSKAAVEAAKNSTIQISLGFALKK